MKYSKRTGHLAVLVANIIFGLNNPISRTMIPEKLSPFALAYFRMSGAALLVWSASLFMKKQQIPFKDILKLLLLFVSIRK